MAEIDFVMWNCSGVNPTATTKEKLDFLDITTKNNFDILTLIETHHRDENILAPQLLRYKSTHHMLHTEATNEDPYAGIIMFISRDFEILQNTDLIKGRLLNTKIRHTITGKKYNITLFYGYTGKNATQAKMKYITQTLENNHNTNDRNIILGDFNFVENDLDRTCETKTGMSQLDKTLNAPWMEFTNKMDLSDPFRENNRKRKMFSYIHTQKKAKSRIDRVYVNDENTSNVTHYKHTHTPFTQTHRILSFKIKGENMRGPGYWKMNTSIIEDPPFQKVIEKTLEDVRKLNIVDSIEHWQTFIETVRIEAQVYSTKKRYYETKIKKNCERNIEMLEQNESLKNDLNIQKEYEYNLGKLKDWQIKKMKGHQTRIKSQPKLEPGEPNIAFFAELEQKTARKNTISQIQNEKGEIKYETQEIKHIATDFYTNLFTPTKTDKKTQEKLLKNIKKQITHTQKEALDTSITLEETEKAVMNLQKEKSPGPDGVPVEFYQKFWEFIKHIYFDFIQEVKVKAFPKEKNISITTLIYKEKGEIYLLTNYRPIALMNVDVKILTKILATRLKYILPTIIHQTQTAVYGRKIGNTIHLVRDLIQLANENNEEAAFLFLDQEKAFDRVDHNFLFDIMHAFGIGKTFINWVRIIYSNATTRLNINGFLTDPIPLKRGVRQGCPLSSFLYVIVIEILALQLRANPNIIGFTVDGEK